MVYVSTYEEIKKILNTRGTTVAVALSGNPSIMVKAHKADVLQTIADRERQGFTGPTDYDGLPVQLCYLENFKMLVLDGGL